MSLVAVAALLGAGASRALTELVPTAAPVVVAAEVSALDYAREATLSTEMRETIELPAPPRSGVVTKVSVALGAALSNGMELYRVDDAPVRVMTGSVVLYRPVGENASSAEVKAVQRFLYALGEFEAEADGHFGPTTKTAVRSYAETMGETGDEFLPDWVMWAPKDAVVVAIGQQLGSPVKEVAVTVRPPVTAFTLDAAPGGPAGAWNFAYQGRMIEVSLDGEGSWAVVDQEAATDLLDRLPSDSEGLSGWLRVKEAQVAAAVPAAAIVGSGEQVCVFSPTGTAISVIAVGSSIDGRVQITGLGDGTEVLANPLDLGYTRCA
ncbi:MAG: peptidoglycan-binding domain-containing protein [Arachnia sp.]